MAARLRRRSCCRRWRRCISSMNRRDKRERPFHHGVGGKVGLRRGRRLVEIGTVISSNVPGASRRRRSTIADDRRRRWIRPGPAVRPWRAAMAFVLAGGTWTPADGTDRQPGQAGGLFWRQTAHHRFRAIQRAQFRHSPHGGGDPIQGAQPDPSFATRLELFRPERNESFDILPASQRVADDQWYLGTADAVYQNIDIIESSIRAISSCWPAITSTRWISSRCCSSTSRGCGRHRRLHGGAAAEASGFGVMHVDAPTGSFVSGETRRSSGDARPAGYGAGQHGHLRVRHALSVRRAARGRRGSEVRAMISARTSFPPGRKRRRWRIRSNAPACAPMARHRPYWRDVGTLILISQPIST